MATQKRKIKTKRSTIAKKRSSNNSSFISRIPRNIKILIVVGAIALIGTIWIFGAHAATSNFEAEVAKKSGGATVSSDATASGGKYVVFNTQTAITKPASIQRFPGDPNPLVTGKAYWGSAVDGNGDPSKHENVAGKSLAIRRTFWGWNSPSMISTAKSDLVANRLPHVSVKTPGWASVASGQHDAELDNMLKQLDSLGGPVWFTVHHEPEGGGGSNGIDDPAGAAGWRNMQKHVRDRINALGTKNIAFMPVLMTWTWDPASGRNYNDWWVNGIWDAYIVDPYVEKEGLSMLADTGWKNFSSWADKKKIPYGTAEWGLRTISGGSWQKKVPDGKLWTNSDCKPENMILKTTTDSQEKVAADNMQAFWDWSFANHKDVISYTYFDSCLNSRKGPWTLAKGQLARFDKILGEDQRVMRVKDLDKPSTTTTTTSSSFGTLTQDITIPANGTYKLWVRLNAPDAVNNAIQAQVDNGTVIKMGDGGLKANTWTWVDYKNGDLNNKATVTLSAGTRKITITGIENGVKIDRVLVTNETCVPLNTGENCTTPITTPPTTTPTTPEPNVTVSGPNEGSTVTGNTTIKVTATFPIQEVSFRIDNQWQTTDKSDPFLWEWNTTKFSNGAHKIVARVRKQGDPGNVYTEKIINVKVTNQAEPTQPIEPVKDTEVPTVPTSLRTNLQFDWTKLRYVMNVMWDASSDNDDSAITYQVLRDASPIGQTTATVFTDSGALEAERVYNYSVTASDATGNVSGPASLSLKTSCSFIFCTAEVL